MPQITPLITTLKKQLKVHGKTYADVAELLQLSEASVKRLFAEQNLTLQRLERICHMVGLEISDLVQSMASDQHKIVQLSLEQEAEIAADLLLLMITVCVINGYTYEDLLDQYDICEHECLQKLALLDCLKIIDLLPGNRIKLLVAPNFSWHANGAIQRFFKEKVEQDFFNSRFEKEHEQLVVLNGLLSTSSNAEFQKKTRSLALEFTHLAQQDKSLPMSKKHGTSVVLAMRQWQFGLFEAFKK